MCGGDKALKSTEANVGRIASAEELRKKQAFGEAFPFAQKRLRGGLPFMKQLTDYRGGITARAAGPQRAGLVRSMGKAGMSERDPAYQANIGDFQANMARGLEGNLRDALMADEMARQQAAQQLFGYGQAQDPLAYYNLLAQMQLQD